MTSAPQEAAETPRATLSYPLALSPEPGTGEAVEVAPGVLWLRMPLEGSLKFINIWAIDDGDGWAIVDTGIQHANTVKAWRMALAGALKGRPITRVIITHMHPDHCGMAGWLSGKHNAPLWMSRLEYITCRMLVADTGREAPEVSVDFYRAAGWNEEELENYRTRFGRFGKMLYKLPDAYRRLSDNDVIRIGKHEWRVVVGSGHSPEHACLHCAGLGLFISGDQLLPRISSNISVFPTEPEADPLGDWLHSLAKLKREVPEDVLVLPSHNDPFIGAHIRLDQLIRGHEMLLDRLQRHLREPRRAVDTFKTLFARPIGSEVLSMATGESIAHLNWLRHRGRAESSLDDHKVAWWRATTKAA